MVRLPVTPDDQAAFDAHNAANPDDQRAAVGEVDFVRDTFANISKREVSGFDFGLKYVMPETRYGRFTISADVAHLTRFDSQRDEQSPVIDNLNINGLPEPRGSASTICWTTIRLLPMKAGAFTKPYMIPGAVLPILICDKCFSDMSQVDINLPLLHKGG